jgi:hypothetical protein
VIAPQDQVVQHHMRTRLRDNIVKTKNFTDGTIRYSQKGKVFSCVKTKTNLTVALSDV